MTELDLPRVNPRDTAVSDARDAVALAFWRAVEAHQLTSAEALSVLAGLLHSFSNSLLAGQRRPDQEEGG